MHKFREKFLNNKFINDVFVKQHYTNHWKVWFAFPIAIIIIAIIVFASFAIANKDFASGINIGIDFSSGNILTAVLKDGEADNNFDAHEKTISDIVSKHGGNVSYSQITGSNAIAVKYANFIDDTDQQKTANDTIVAEVKTALSAVSAEEEFVTIKNMGATASSDLLSSAFLSLFITIILMLVYVTFRFRFWSGIAAICALAHDILILLACTIIFHIQINASFIAAVITIVAYSINDTIVIFDRVRENTKINDLENKLDTAGVVNLSVKQSLARSMKTSLTTLFSIVLLAIIGVAAIKEFALPVIFGLIAGTFSSIFISPSIYVLLVNGYDKRKKNRINGTPKNMKKEKKPAKA